MSKNLALACGAAALLLLLANPAQATGGSQTFRVVTTGDAYMIALSSSCPGTYGPPDAGDPTAFDPECFAVKTALGYDGETGASTNVPLHVNHAFRCTVTNSATAPVGNLLPFPADMTISDSIVVGFDLNGDSAADTRYGGRVNRPPIGEVLNRLSGSAASGDVGTLAGTPTWYASQFSLNGATPDVSGNVDGPGLIIWNQGGSDVTIGCSF